MRISRVGSKRDGGEGSIRLEVKPHGSQAFGDEIFTWNGRDFEFKNKRIKDFPIKNHHDSTQHDYTVAISPTDIHAILLGIKAELEVIARSKHRFSSEQKLLDDFEPILQLFSDMFIAYAKALKARQP